MTPSIAVCVPHYGLASMAFVQSLASQMHTLGGDGFDRACLVHGSASTGAFRARNQIMQSLEIAERQVGYKFEWTMWFDGDMTFPSRTIQGLLSHGKDIIGATYKRRVEPFELLGRPATSHTATAVIGSLAPAGSLPTGCLLINRKVFASIKKPIWKIVVGADLKDDKGEDILFCEEARAAGYEVWLDTALTMKVGHLAEIPLFAEGERSSIVHPQVLHG